MNDNPAKHYPKLFVLDTNVILHDAGCIRNFEENDIAIPITVLEELDRFKKGHDDIHFQAREFLRSFDQHHRRRPFRAGGRAGPGAGVDPRRAGRRTGAATQGGLPERRPRSSHPQHGLAAATAGVAPPGRAGHQGHEPADEGQGPGRDRAGLHQRQGGERRHALLRQADRGEHARRGDRRLLQREPRGGPREPAAGRRAQGQRELHSPQRLEIGAGRLSARQPTPS